VYPVFDRGGGLDWRWSENKQDEEVEYHEDTLKQRMCHSKLSDQLFDSLSVFIDLNKSFVTHLDKP
jgi:hypothetical protein